MVCVLVRLRIGERTSIGSHPVARWRRNEWDEGTKSPRQDALVTGDGGGDDPPTRYEALCPQVATRSGAASATERATGPRGRVEVGARFRTGRLRQDDAAGRVAHRRHGRWMVFGLAFARPAGQRSSAVLDVPCRRAEEGGTRGRWRFALASAVSPAAERI